MRLLHLTLSTGHAATHRIDTFSPDAVAACRALLPRGGPVPAFPAFAVDIEVPFFTIYRARAPLATCLLGGPASAGGDSWPALAEFQGRYAPVLADRPHPSQNYLAVVLLPALALCAQTDIAWLADFERCLAAAILLPSVST